MKNFGADKTIKSGMNNSVEAGNNITVEGNIVGMNNNISISSASIVSTVKINIRGSNNRVNINAAHAIQGMFIFIHGNRNVVDVDECASIQKLTVSCGNQVPANDTSLIIGKKFSIGRDGRFFLYNNGNKLNIGSDCLFSNNITVRCGESPHLIFDKDSGSYLDISDGVFIGDHCWVGEETYLTKRTTLPNECVVGACSVVTKRFEEMHTVIAGNPAKVVRKGIKWIRNHKCLNEEGFYQIPHRDFNSK